MRWYLQHQANILQIFFTYTVEVSVVKQRQVVFG